MKLLQKTNRTYLFFSALLFTIAGCLLYFILTSILEEEVSEKLYVNKRRIVKKIENGEAVVSLPPVIEVEELNKNYRPELLVKDTVLYDPIEEEPEHFREVTSIETINGKTWRITLRQVMLEPHDYLNSIGVSLAIVMTLLLLGLFIMNRFVSRKLLQPFYHSLEELKRFSPGEDKTVVLHSSDITEFRDLNKAIITLTERVRSDYLALKEFTENASHEIQTPLSIILSKLELLIQSSNLGEEQAEQITSAWSAARRLSKLGQTLLLLTKIENRQYAETVNIRLAEAVEKQIASFTDFIHAKNITVNKKLNYVQTLTTNPLLLDTLLSNLLSNAVKYNVEGGTINIELQTDILSVSNTGIPLSMPPEKMFERFSKASPTSDSLGLGLAIVKRICESNNWRISYTSKGEWHILQVKF